MTERTGIWLIGARGSLATTVIAGCELIARGEREPIGLATELPELKGLGFQTLDNLVFGGHEIRSGSLFDSATQIARENGSIPGDAPARIRDALDRADQWIRSGTPLGCGPAVERMAQPASTGSFDGGLRQRIDQIGTDLSQFREENDLARLVVVNLASTEPPLSLAPAHQELAELDRLLDGNQVDQVRASLLYAYAAFDGGHAYVNFTPSNAALIPALIELAASRGVPFMGSDGKTGETLVKSVLAPLFRHRALQVLSWQGYNMLGNRDGNVLADSDNLESKVKSKDGVLASILGYPLHTHVGIDYVPSLEDQKTAWDFIHFKGFLGHRMSMQFIWQGCDSVLAAPIVLDLIRFADLALRRGEAGPMEHLACFFKSPLGVQEHDFHRQWEMLLEYARTDPSG